MTELDQLIAAAFTSEGKQEDVNKVYLALLRSPLFVPVEKIIDETADFKPLFAKIEENYFMFVFDDLERLTAWAGEEMAQMDYVELKGMEVVFGINDEVFLCLNAGAEFYKEFAPDEVKRLKMVASKIEQMRGLNS